jgi:N-acetylglucosamine kinase-like BadF-type ATPase
VIGVDGGGTKTLAQAADLNGLISGRGLAGPSNYNVVGFEPACQAIETAIGQALQAASGEIAAVCMGLAGVGRPEDVERFQVWAHKKFPAAAITVVNDAEILLAAGAPAGAPALALICGTGSIVYGRAVSGQMLRAGGWGYLFGDEGSGYAIGASALRAVMRAEDGRGAPTLLTRLVLARRGLENPAELVRNIYGAESPRAEIAGLADLVEQAAAEDDVQALAILDEAALALARTVQAVYRKLGQIPIPLALTGSVILRGEYLLDAFRWACDDLGMVFSTISEISEPVDGAIKLALENIRAAGL